MAKHKMRKTFCVMIYLLLISFTEGDSEVIGGLNEMVVLNCSLDPDPVTGLVIQWKINNLTSSDILEGVVTENRLLYINCSEMYNNSRVQCERVDILDSSQRFLGDVYNLQIQGLLDEVREVNVSINCSSITLTWQPPFSLDLPNTDPDMTFCVEVYNVSEGERTPLHHLGRCSIVTPHYIIPTNNSGLILHYQFIVTAVNVVGRGAPNNSTEITYNYGIWLHDARWIKLNLELLLLNISLVTSVCILELTVYFDCHDIDSDTDCSCPVQATPELNQLQYLILNNKSSCSRCLDASVNCTVHVETDDGALSNSLTLMFFTNEDTQTSNKTIGIVNTTSSNSRIIILVSIGVASVLVLLLHLFGCCYCFYCRVKMKIRNTNANLYTEVRHRSYHINSSNEVSYSIPLEPTYSLSDPAHPDSSPAIRQDNGSEHHSQEVAVSNSPVSAHSLLKPVDPHTRSQQLVGESIPSDLCEGDPNTDKKIRRGATSGVALHIDTATAEVKKGVIYSQVEVSRSTSGGVVMVHDVVYSDIIPSKVKPVMDEKTQAKQKPAEMIIPQIPPTAENVFHDMYSIAGKWSDFALRIGIDEDLEDEIYTNNETNEACLQETLEYFFKRRAPFKEITDALGYIEEYELANTLSKKYITT